MKLTEKAVRIYQYSAIFFSIISLMLVNHPIAFLTPIFIVLTLTIYVNASLRKLRKIDERLFKSFLSISPNILSLGDKARVRLNLEYMMLDRLKAEVQVILDKDIKVEEGKTSWIGILDYKKSILLEFTVKAERTGLLNIGPVIIIVKDDFEFVAKVIELKVTGILFSFLEATRAREVTTASKVKVSNQPGYTLNLFLGIDEEYRESIESDQPSLKKIDWRRIARTGGQEVYVKEYVKRRASDIVIGLGSGLDVETPSIGEIRAWVIQIVLSYAMYYLREGSRVWLLQYNDGKPTYSELNLSYGELVTRDEIEPAGGLVIYISRLIDPEELGFLKNGIDLQKFRLIVLVLDITEEVSEYVKDYVVAYEDERLRKLKTELCEVGTIIKLRDLVDGFRRVLAHR